MMIMSEIISSWRPVCARRWEPFPSSSEWASVLSLFSVGDWEGILLWLFASFLCPFSRTAPPGICLLKQQPLWLDCKTFTLHQPLCVDMQHTRKSWAVPGLLYTCLVGPDFHLFVPKIQVWLHPRECVSWWERDLLLSCSVLLFIRDLGATHGFMFGNSFLCKEKTKITCWERILYIFPWFSTYLSDCFHTLG